MTGLKNLLKFLYGAFMATCIWIFFEFPIKTSPTGALLANGWVIPFIVVFSLSGMFTVVYCIMYLLEHWSDR
jgi:hypothetical protein